MSSSRTRYGWRARRGNPNRGLTRDAYTVDLRQFTGWSRSRSLPLFSVRRAGIGTFVRELEARSRARVTVTRRLSK